MKKFNSYKIEVEVDEDGCVLDECNGILTMQGSKYEIVESDLGVKFIKL